MVPELVNDNEALDRSFALPNDRASSAALLYIRPPPHSAVQCFDHVAEFVSGV